MSNRLQINPQSGAHTIQDFIYYFEFVNIVGMISTHPVVLSAAQSRLIRTFYMFTSYYKTLSDHFNIIL